MNINNDNLIKISERIVGDSIDSDYMGDISLFGDELRFFGIEFDYRFILELNHLVCSRADNYDTEHKIYSIIGKNKDDTKYTKNIEDIKTFNFSNCKFSYKVFLNISNQTKIIIDGCIFEKELYVNKDPYVLPSNRSIITINQFHIEDSIIKDIFLMEKCVVRDYRIVNVEFDNHVKISNVIFDEISKNTVEEPNGYFVNCSFEKNMVLEDITFKEFVMFEYTNFRGHVVFKNILFENGLDLSSANIAAGINFLNLNGLDTESSKEKTPRETYRIIKHNFQKIGNIIEANKYHVLEQVKYHKEIWSKHEITLEYLSDGVISFLLWISSNFSKYWFLPLIWIFIVGMITTSIIIGDMTLSNIIKYATITKYDYAEKHPILFLFNKVSLGFLYYQFVLSVRKNTRK